MNLIDILLGAFIGFTLAVIFYPDLRRWVE